MIIKQIEFKINAKSRGFHLITNEIMQHLDIEDIDVGTVNLLLQHTSASLSLNENCDKSVRDDMESFFNEVVCENKSYFTHTYEGEDDMPAHIKSSILGTSLSIPITKGQLNLGTWQGIYLGEHRNDATKRTIIATIMGV